jgi:chaperonin GroES
MSKKKANSVPVQPLSDRVLVRDLMDEEKERKLDSGLILPASVKDDSGGAKKAKVVAVGPGKFDENGNQQPMSVKVGDVVLFSWGDALKLDDIQYHIVTESNILGIINN